MNVTEVLQFADQLFFEQTGKHLDDSQEIVIKGVWDGKTYEAIADEYNRSERHVRDIGYKLWQILS
jgi:DNA-binding NarL/FixJ family response regulator